MYRFYNIGSKQLPVLEHIVPPIFIISSLVFYRFNALIYQIICQNLHCFPQVQQYLFMDSIKTHTVSHYYFTVGCKLLQFLDLSATLGSLGLDNSTVIFVHLHVQGGSTSYNIEFPELSPEPNTNTKGNIQIS
ncbi:hypothetical protein BDQ17DRAFT_1332475 [Cyathus striatus]|nr:hypothetical protein BDQ17DRAFT_1332475 [Cyathus striatus]